jgi:hypothetical protein
MRTLADRRLSALALAGALLLATSCSAVSSVMGGVTGSTQKKEAAEKVARVQAQLMAFADVYAGEVLAMTSSVQQQTAAEQLFVLGFQVRQATAAYEIASGTIPYAGVLDMVVLVSLTRWSLDAYWAPWIRKDALDPLRRSLATLEPRAWAMAEEILEPDQVKKLQDFIDAWKKEHEQAREVASVRLADVTAGPGGGGVSLGTTTELLQSFGLNPFGGLDPAVQEVQQSRVLAERAFYFVKRWPRLLELQARQLALQLSLQPAPAQLSSDVTRVSLAAESLARTAAGLPELADREREAAIRQFLDALSAQEARARTMLADLRRTLDAGTGAADAVKGALASLDAVVTQLAAPPPPGSPPSKPFDVTEYTRALKELGDAATQVQALLQALDQDAPRAARLLGDAGREVSERGHALVDHAFRRLLTLGLALVAAVLVAALVYRWVASRITRA